MEASVSVPVIMGRDRSLGIGLNGDNIVTSIEDDSAAARAGVRLGDIVLGWQGRPLDGVRLQDVLRPAPVHVLSIARASALVSARFGATEAGPRLSQPPRIVPSSASRADASALARASSESRAGSASSPPPPRGEMATPRVPPIEVDRPPPSAHAPSRAAAARALDSPETEEATEASEASEVRGAKGGRRGRRPSWMAAWGAGEWSGTEEEREFADEHARAALP